MICDILWCSWIHGHPYMIIHACGLMKSHCLAGPPCVVQATWCRRTWGPWALVMMSVFTWACNSKVPSCFMALLSPPTSLHDVIIPSSRFTIVTVVKAEWHQKWKERKAQRVVHESMKPTSTSPLFFSLPLFQTNIVLQKNSQAWGWGNGSIFCVIFFVDMAIPLKLDLFCNQSPRMTNAVFVAACCAKNSCFVTFSEVTPPPRHGCNKTKPSLPTSTSVGPVSISRGSMSFCWEMLDNIISWNSNDEISQLKQPYPRLRMAKQTSMAYIPVPRLYGLYTYKYLYT